MTRTPRSTTEMAEYKAITDLLGSMLGHGVYSIGIARELEPFGFTLEGVTLRYRDRSVTLPARDRQGMVLDMGSDGHGGILNDVPDDLLMIDAVDLSRAVYLLLTGRERAPSEGYVGRGFGFKADVRAIERIEHTRRNADA